MVKPIFILFALLFIGVLVHGPILNIGFFSDDFVVLNRLKNGDFNQGSFFRPVADWSLYMDYLIWEKNATGFHITNVLLHIITAWLVYLLVWALVRYLDLNTPSPFILAASSAMLFLIYPFHSEPVIWVVGRGILLSCLFVILSFLLYLRSYNTIYFPILASAVYFVALLNYESAIVLPFILFATELISLKRKCGIRINVWKILPFLIVTGIYLFVRWYNIGSVVGTSSYFRVSASAGDLVLNLFRLGERTILPPLPNYKFAIVIAITVFTASCIFAYIKRNSISLFGHFLFLSAVCFFLALMPVLTIGIDTHTNEGERFLYLPSVFFCMFASAFILSVSKNCRFKIAAFSGVSFYFLFCLFTEFRNWKRSDEITGSILGNHREYPTKGILYVIDLPEDFKGAFIFRNGFYQAFEFYERSFVRKEQLKILSQVDLDDRNKRLGLQSFNKHFTIGSRFIAEGGSGDRSVRLIDISSNQVYQILHDDKVFYFDGEALRQLVY